jgi:hypothetical protein
VGSTPWSVTADENVTEMTVFDGTLVALDNGLVAVT